jgi:predicted ABC-type ATPase
MRRMDLVVGPNGAGKTTFVSYTLAASLPPGTPFVNADEIARERWPDDPAGHAYEAADTAARTRTALLERGVSFMAETVFSHPSKLELITDAVARDYEVFLHVLLVPEDLTVARVRYRVEGGGHSVPVHKIRARYQRLWPLVAAAIVRAHAATVYDNAAADGPRIVAQFVAGQRVMDPAWPSWTPTQLRRL